jgi:outer membrane protein OmpA-like peptidoglycan-associated protein
MPSTGRRGQSLLLGGAGLFLLAGCAAPKAPPPPVETPSLFILLPEPDGGVGQITITNSSGTQVLNQSRQGSTVLGTAGAPSRPFVVEDAQVQQTFGRTLNALPPEPVHFVLYCKDDSDDLTAESLALLPQFFRTVRDRSPADISIVGHTDTRGERDYNYKLGLRRANKVADLLATQGVDKNALDITSHGENDLLVPTRDQVAEPRNRRVEIIVR